MLILEKILAIIATFPITSIEHRKKISTYNDKIRETLKTSFETEDKEKLQKLGLEKFWKYNNQYWQAF
ncbi:MAG: hypothetical protein LBP53_03030 [Candidatus Peribacteria bacterium]|jgi:hypothetical protein|nr:hypothetical protein [Candidatus Peribacteria bacterium]